MFRYRLASVGTLAIALSSIAAGAQTQTVAANPAPSSSATPVSEVVVTASRQNLLGIAATASQGSVTKEALALRPIYRIGQLYETIPGLVVTVHSGESKANQYQLRGFDLDHGTDFASFVDGMPVNRGTNAHGQGYSDQNFLMPQIVSGLDYTKGPYYADNGDFSAVGSARVFLTDDLPDQLSASAGTLGDEDIFAGGTYHIDADDRIWAAVDYGHLDGPWTPPSNFNKVNLATRYSHGDDANGYSLTAMYYQSAGLLETDQSIYAIQEGLIGRYGVLDPTDHGRSARWSLSGRYGVTGDGWAFTANAYDIHSTMSLNNNFTHFLLDPVNGDQEQQDETRDVFGGDAAVTLARDFGPIRTSTVFGLQERYDDIYVDRRHTLHGDITLDYCEVPAVPSGTLPNGLLPPPANTPPGALNDGGNGEAYAAVNGACNADRVHLNDFGAYVQNTTHWTPWLRTVIGFREEDFHAFDHSLTLSPTFTGSTTQTLPQPKGSIVFGPWFQSELYVIAGRGFHSNDVRGVFGTVGLEGLTPTAGPTPLLAPTTGEEVGLRSNVIPKLNIQVAAFREDFSSELAFDEDQGQDQPTAPSRRQGVEFSGEYRPFNWIEFNTDLSFTRARYQGSLATLQNVYQLDGPYIANAPSFIGSAGILIDNLGPWFGSLQWRDLGAYPISDGDQYPQDKGYSEVNAEVGYKVSPKFKVQASVYNLFDTRANAAAFDYESQLTPTSAPVTGPQVHPLEPISGRFAVTYTF
jgi:outer membrane receptor protein involved in Fe transport